MEYPTYNDVLKAQAVINRYLPRTPTYRYPSLSSLAAAVAVLASGSGELDPLLVRFQTAPAASAVAAKAPAKPAPS